MYKEDVSFRDLSNACVVLEDRINRIYELHTDLDQYVYDWKIELINIALKFERMKKYTY